MEAKGVSWSIFFLFFLFDHKTRQPILHRALLMSLFLRGFVPCIMKNICTSSKAWHFPCLFTKGLFLFFQCNTTDTMPAKEKWRSLQNIPFWSPSLNISIELPNSYGNHFLLISVSYVTLFIHSYLFPLAKKAKWDYWGHLSFMTLRTD